MRVAILVLAAAAAFAGCGYSVGPVKPVRDASTVSLPIFENKTYRRGAETDITRLLVAEVQSRTTMRVVETGADLVVEGTIVKMDEVLISQGDDQTIRESTMLVTVDVLIRDGRTGEPIRARERITERESFVPGIGESIRSARIEAFRRIAADIVDLLGGG